MCMSVCVFVCFPCFYRATYLELQKKSFLSECQKRGGSLNLTEMFPVNYESVLKIEGGHDSPLVDTKDHEVRSDIATF